MWSLVPREFHWVLSGHWREGSCVCALQGWRRGRASVGARGGDGRRCCRRLQSPGPATRIWAAQRPDPPPPSSPHTPRFPALRAVRNPHPLAAEPQRSPQRNELTAFFTDPDDTVLVLRLTDCTCCGRRAEAVAKGGSLERGECTFVQKAVNRPAPSGATMKAAMASRRLTRPSSASSCAAALCCAA